MLINIMGHNAWCVTSETPSKPVLQLGMNGRAQHPAIQRFQPVNLGHPSCPLIKNAELGIGSYSCKIVSEYHLPFKRNHDVQT